MFGHIWVVLEGFWRNLEGSNSKLILSNFLLGMTRAAVPGTGPAQKRLSPGGPEFPYVFLYVKIRDGPVFFYTKKRPGGGWHAPPLSI